MPAGASSNATGTARIRHCAWQSPLLSPSTCWGHKHWKGKLEMAHSQGLCLLCCARGGGGILQAAQADDVLLLTLHKQVVECSNVLIQRLHKGSLTLCC